MKFMTIPLLFLATLPLTYSFPASANDVSDLTTDLASLTESFSGVAADARKLQLSITGAAAAQRILTTVTIDLMPTYAQTLDHAKTLTPCPITEDDAPVLATSFTNWTDVLVDAFSIDKSDLMSIWGLKWATITAINVTRDNTVNIMEAIENCASDSIKQIIQDDKGRFIAQAAVTLEIYS